MKKILASIVFLLGFAALIYTAYCILSNEWLGTKASIAVTTTALWIATVIGQQLLARIADVRITSMTRLLTSRTTYSIQSHTTWTVPDGKTTTAVDLISKTLGSEWNEGKTEAGIRSWTGVGSKFYDPNTSFSIDAETQDGDTEIIVQLQLHGVSGWNLSRQISDLESLCQRRVEPPFQWLHQGITSYKIFGMDLTPSKPISSTEQIKVRDTEVSWTNMLSQQDLKRLSRQLRIHGYKAREP